MTSIRRSLLLFPLLSFLALLSACGSDTPADLGEVLRSTIDVTVSPNPIAGTQNTLTAAVTASYTVTITEYAGLGGELLFVNSSVYDPVSGKLMAQTLYDAADLTVFVGTKRVDALSSLSFLHNVSYTLSDLSKAAPLTVSAQFKDDRGNVISTSTLVQIQ